MKGARVVIHGTREDSPSTFQEGDTMPILAEQIAKASGRIMSLQFDLTFCIEKVARSILCGVT
jgi:hypothetical protein